MNKLITALVFLLSVCGTITAQVGIGTTSPETSAALDVSSTDRGFLMPRMTTAQREAIVNPVNSLTVFDTDTKTFQSYIEGVWIPATPGVGKFIDGATPDIAYYPERVGIGINTFSTGHLLYVESIKDNDAKHTSTVVSGIYDGSGLSDSTNGLAAIARNNSTGTIEDAVGVQGNVENPNAGGTIDNATGSWPEVSNFGNIGWGSAITGTINNESGATMQTGRSENLSVYNRPGATLGSASLSSMYMVNEGSITNNAYGLWIGGASTGSVGGNAYALYIATPYTNITGDNFALYSDNTANSYFEGNLGIGTSDPLQKVHISGVMRLEPQATEPAGDMGDFYVGSDGVLYFHNGAGWGVVQVAAP